MTKFSRQSLFCSHCSSRSALPTGMAAVAQQQSVSCGHDSFVAPNSASTPPDIISRIIAKELSEAEGLAGDRGEPAGWRNNNCRK